MATSPPGRDNTAWLIDHQPVVEQCLADLAAWVEDDVQPVGTSFTLQDGRIVLPPTAAERQGIQPVVRVRANGQGRTEVAVGDDVSIECHAEVPPTAGTIIGLKWDFDGSGTYPETAKVDGAAAAVTVATSHRFDAPGTYFVTAFVTALVESHADGDGRRSPRRVSGVLGRRAVVRARRLFSAAD